METKKVRAFDLPKMKIEDIADVKQLITDLDEAQLFFSILQDRNGELKCLLSEMNDELFVAVMAALHRNVFVHDFVRLAFIAIERFRNGHLEEATEFMQQAITYIKQKKQTL